MITSVAADRTVNTENLTGGISANSEAAQQFMQLLITQLQYQDPMNPMESKEFTAQLAQFTELEQIIQMNDSLGALKLYEESASNARALNLIGKTARAETANVKVTDTEGAQIHFELATDAAQTKVHIYDSSGLSVRTLDLGALNEGEQTIQWDGKNSAGEYVSPGLYQLEVAAEDVYGETVDSSVFLEGVVDSVQFKDGETAIMVAGVPVSIADILKVSQ